MGKEQRTRGAAYEREVCQRLTFKFGRVIKRKLGQARDGGSDIEAGPLRIECKRRRAIAVYDWLAQVFNQEKEDDRLPVVVARADGQRSIAILDFEDFLTLIPDGSEEAAMALNPPAESDPDDSGSKADPRSAGKVVDMAAFIREVKGSLRGPVVRHGQHGRGRGQGPVRSETAAVG